MWPKGVMGGEEKRVFRNEIPGLGTVKFWGESRVGLGLVIVMVR